MSNPSQTHRKARARNLVACVRRIGDVRMYLGATNNDCPAFDFERSYNGQSLVKRRGKRVTEAVIRAQAEDELAIAKDFFRKACLTCEFCKQGSGPNWCGNKDTKEDLFWQIFNDPKVRVRFYNRIKTPLFTGGEKTLTCAMALRPGRLKKSDWIE